MTDAPQPVRNPHNFQVLEGGVEHISNGAEMVKEAGAVVRNILYTGLGRDGTVIPILTEEQKNTAATFFRQKVADYHLRNMGSGPLESTNVEIAGRAFVECLNPSQLDEAGMEQAFSAAMGALRQGGREAVIKRNHQINGVETPAASPLPGQNAADSSWITRIMHTIRTIPHDLKSPKQIFNEARNREGGKTELVFRAAGAATSLGLMIGFTRRAKEAVEYDLETGAPKRNITSTVLNTIGALAAAVGVVGFVSYAPQR